MSEQDKVHKPEYTALVQAVMVAKGYYRERAESALNDAMVDIEQGDASYASAAIALNLHVNYQSFSVRPEKTRLFTTWLKLITIPK